MPLAAENFIQENSGTVTRPAGSTSVSVSLPASTTAGNTGFIIITSPVNLTAGPSGWVTESVGGAGTYFVSRRDELPAAETSWTYTCAALGADQGFAWYVAELSGVDPVEPLEVSASTSGTVVTDGGTKSTGTTAQTAALDTVAIAALAVQQAAGTETQSWSGWTNGFGEVVEVAPNFAGARQLAVARKFTSGVAAAVETTATLATTAGGGSNAVGVVLVYRAAGSPIAVAPLAHFVGMEWGTHGGINSHGGSSNMMGSALTVSAGTWGTNYLIQAASARNSGYGLQVVQSGAAAYVYVGNLTGSIKAVTYGFNVRVASATGTVVVAEPLTSGAGTIAQLLYDATTSKFGVRCGTTGTTSWASTTTATNTWVWVDLRVKVSTSTWRAEWRLETAADTYTDQSAAELTGQSVTSFGMLRLGVNAAQTMTVDYDDVCISRYWATYPLGPHEIRLLGVDPAGTPSVFGTASNFSVFTANGTLGAWNATNARNAVDEVPPTVSASADGVVQTATATGDYMEFPMAACTLAADEVIAGVRMLAPAWGGAGAGTGTLGIRGWDGTTETTLIDTSVSYDAGSPTAVSSTEPRWQCAMWPFPTGGWTQTRLDATTLRVGFSSDAAPDMGVDALYLEYATHKAVTQPLFGTLASQAVDPNTLGVRAVTVDTTTTSQAADLYYEESGSPTTVPVGASTTQTETIDAPDLPTANYIALYPDPEP